MNVSIWKYFILAALPLLAGCMSWDYEPDSDFSVNPAPGRGLFIVNEGNFQYGNATLSYYDTETHEVENEVFVRANSQKLGDVAQSMIMHDGTAWIVVNNSHVLFAIDPVTFVEKGRITGLTSPRYMHFISDEKAYVTQLWDSRIFIINPKTRSVTGYIETGMDDAVASTERIVEYGDHVFVNCHSYQRTILKIDTGSDEIEGRLEVGLQPNSMAIDKNGKLWVLTDGGYPGSAAGYEPATLSRIDPDTFRIEKTFTFYGDSDPSELNLNVDRDTLYFINDDVWKMPVDAETLPSVPFIGSRNTKYYSMTVCPWNSDVYVADAIDYQQKGIIYRYSAAGKLLDEFRAGIIPGFFCWY